MATKQKSGAVKKAAAKKADKATTKAERTKPQGRGHDLEMYKVFSEWLEENVDVKVSPKQIEAVRANFNQKFKKSDAFKEYKAQQQEARAEAREAKQQAAAERKEAREAKAAERAQRREAREQKAKERAAKAKEKAKSGGKRTAGKTGGKSAAAKSTPKSNKSTKSTKSTKKSSKGKAPKEDF